MFQNIPLRKVVWSTSLYLINLHVMSLCLWPLSKLTTKTETPTQPAPTPGHSPGTALVVLSMYAATGATWRGLGNLWGIFSSIYARHLSVPHSPLLRPDQTKPNMTSVGSTVLLAALLALVGICSAGSDAPRGVAVGFVFDPKAKCDPPCEHAGICIRNNTCFCSRGYEGETCQYGDVTTLLL